MDKEFDELQGILDTIVTTAKLLDYKIERTGNWLTFWNNYEPFGALVMKYKIYLNNRKNIVLIINSAPLSTLPHEEKIIHLQEVLEKL